MTLDVLIVGGGPAGSACARRAAQSNLNVLLIEKKKHPRNKICAGGFRPAVRDLLDFDIGSAIEQELCGSHIYSPSKIKVNCTKSSLTGYTVKRSVFDNLLIEKAIEAGANVVEDTKVIKVEEENKKVKVITRDGDLYESRYVVGADGVNSIVARFSKLKDHWRKKEIGLCMEASIPLASSDIFRIFNGGCGSNRLCLKLFFGGLKHGYAWGFPKKNEVSLGMGCLMPYARDLKMAWRKFLHYFEKNFKVKTDVSNQMAMRVPLAGPVRKTATKRVMLIGDAAGFVSPATGEGIYYAIKTGIICAEAIPDLINGCKKNAIEYEKRWKHEMGKEMRIANSIAKLLFRSQKNMEIVVSLAKRDKIIQELMANLIGGLESYNQLRNSIFKRILYHHTLSGLKMLL